MNKLFFFSNKFLNSQNVTNAISLKKTSLIELTKEKQKFFYRNLNETKKKTKTFGILKSKYNNVNHYHLGELFLAFKKF